MPSPHSTTTPPRTAALFDAQADEYKKHRPTYNAAVVAAVLGRSDAASITRALDVGAGSGQLTRKLAAALPPSAHVEGVDACAAQVQCAEGGGEGAAGATFSFRVADTLATGADDASIDLLTVAQALHWLMDPLEAGDDVTPPRPFYIEAARVLRPRATLAAISYGVPRLEGANSTPLTTASAALLQFHDGLDWEPARWVAINGMRGLDPRPAEGFDSVARTHTTMASTTSLDGVLGYLASWSAVAAAVSRGEGAVLDRARTALASALAADGWEGGSVTLAWPVTVMLATRVE